MGARGPCPVPTPILNLRGSRVPERRPNEPQAEPGRPLCPSWLKGEGRAMWNRTCKQLEQMGILFKADQGALTGYCAAWGEMCLAEKKLAASEDAYTFTTEKGYEGQSPWVSIRNGAAERLAKFGARLGLSPADRARVQVMAPKDGKRKVMTRDRSA